MNVELLAVADPKLIADENAVDLGKRFRKEVRGEPGTDQHAGAGEHGRACLASNHGKAGRGGADRASAQGSREDELDSWRAKHLKAEKRGRSYELESDLGRACADGPTILDARL